MARQSRADRPYSGAVRAAQAFPFDEIDDPRMALSLAHREG
jgi:hypothetical protein